MHIRRYREKDCREIIQLFYDTVHSINAKDYTESQLAAWAPQVAEISLMIWDKSLRQHYTVIAEDHNKIVGFGSIDNTGYLDKLFVHKDFQGKRIASKLCNELEQYVREKGISVMTTEASITAKPFFEKYGYQVIKKQLVERKGEFLTNYLMQKNLG